jgi:hypothetical protein
MENCRFSALARGGMESDEQTRGQRAHRVPCTVFCPAFTALYVTRPFRAPTVPGPGVAPLAHLLSVSLSRLRSTGLTKW